MEYTDISLNTFGKHISHFIYRDDDKVIKQVEPFRDGFLYNLHSVKVRSNVK